MRKYMHRLESKDSEIDPMNAPTKTIFYDRSKTGKVNQYEKPSSGKNIEKSTPIKKQPQTFPKSLEKFSDSKISDEKYEELKKN